MFKNLKIGTRLGLGFGLVLLLLVVISVTALLRISNLASATRLIVDDRLPKIEMISEVQENTLNIGRAIRNVILATDAKFEKGQLEIIVQLRKHNEEVLDKLRPSITNPKGKELFEQVVAARKTYNAALDAITPIAFSGSPQFDAKKATEYLFSDFTKPANDYVEATRAFSKFQKELAAESGVEATDTARSATIVVLILSVIATLIAVVFAWWVTASITTPIKSAVDAASRLADGDFTVELKADSHDEVGILMNALQNMTNKLKDIIAQVRNSANELTTASTQVAATSQVLSQATSEQAASLEETTSAIEQMSASIAQNTDNSKTTDGIAHKSANDALSGGEAVRSTVAAMKSIADKISIIDDIAYRTDLLALNAAIEAARAGEHGKGFAVVAAEVRKLAERSQVAAQEIGELAGSSVETAESAGKLLETMLPSIRKTADLVSEITAASEEQATGVGQISQAMTQLNSTTQQNAASSEELSATAEEMNAQAENLMEVMSYFKIDGDSARASVPSVAKAKAKVHAAKRKANPDSEMSDFEKF